MALLFFGMFAVAYVMINISKSDFRLSLYDLHKSTGVLLLLLVFLRLFWQAINTKPDLAVPNWQRQIAKWNIRTLYVLMFVMPITGFLTSTLGNHIISVYGLIKISPLANNKAASLFFSNAHELLSFLLIAVFILHLLGALYHHFILKDDVLKRIWFK